MELILFIKRFLFGRCKNKTVGLFGTCGDSTWRNAYINQFISGGINFYNPQFTDREYDNAIDPIIEAAHLSNDRVIIFPVLGITDGITSLGELGQAEMKIALSWNRHLIIFVEALANPHYVKDETKRAKSDQMRSLIRAHLADIHHPRIHIVDSEEEMWNVTWDIVKSL